jgi:hypothetical protein
VLSPGEYARLTALVDGEYFQAAFSARDAVGTVRDNGGTVDMIGVERRPDGSTMRVRLTLQGFRGLGTYALALTSTGFTYGEIGLATSTSPDVFVQYQTGLGLSGTVRVTTWDEKRRLIGGFFEFRARQTTSTRTLDLTQGVFNGRLAR